MPGAWSGVPATYTPGELVTDVILNAEVRDRLLWLGGTAGIISLPAYSVSTAGASTTSASLVVMTAPSITLTTSGIGITVVLFGLSVSHSIGGTASNFGVFMDGASISGGVARTTAPTTNYTFNIVGGYQHTPAGASHTYQIGWSTAAGTLSLDTNVQAWISVLELRR